MSNCGRPSIGFSRHWSGVRTASNIDDAGAPSTWNWKIFARAVWSFEDALKVDENYEEAMYNLAVLKTDDMPLAAIGLLERAIEIDPDYAIAHQKLGALHQKQRDVVRAEYHFRRADGLGSCRLLELSLSSECPCCADRDEEAEGL